MHPERRVWVLPAALAALIASMPAQMWVEHTVSEPYPGLFQPFFWGTAQNEDEVVVYPFAKLFVDGRRVRPADALTRSDRREALKQMFPPNGGAEFVDAAARRAMRTNLARRFGTDPRELVVRWEERRFDLDTGDITRHRTTATYRVDFRGDAP